MNDKMIEKIADELKKPLPGEMYQLLMAPESRKSFHVPITEKTKNSSVLIPIYENNNEFYTALFQRPEYDGVHSDQICFPGGKREPSDKDLKETAIRETREEIGIIPEKITILGPLTPLHIPVSDYLVHPFVAYVSYVPDYKIDPLEVKKLLITPIKNILDERSKKQKAMVVHGQKIIVPIYEIDGFVVWGATAMIISEWSELLRRVNFQHTG